MRRLLLVAVIGVAASASAARADGIPRYMPCPNANIHGWGPHASSVTWPSAYPPGWYTATYTYQWYMPWYAYYNFSHGPYANWMAGGGYAGYANHGPAGYFYYPNVKPAEPYIGEWMGRVSGRPTPYDVLQGKLMPAAPPAQVAKTDDKKEEKKDEKKEDKKDKKE